MNSLWFDKDLKNATETARIHHQLTPNEVFAEKAVLQVRPFVCLSVLSLPQAVVTICQV